MKLRVQLPVCSSNVLGKSTTKKHTVCSECPCVMRNHERQGESSPFTLAVGSVLKELDLQQILNAY